MPPYLAALTLLLALFLTACGGDDPSPTAATAIDGTAGEADDGSTPPPADANDATDAGNATTPPAAASGDALPDADTANPLTEVVTQLPGPRALLFGHPASDIADELFVVNFVGAEAAWIQNFGADDQRAVGIQNSLFGAIAAAMDDEGLFYFACFTPVMGSNVGVITVRDFDSQVSDFQYNSVSAPVGVAIDPDGRLYVANQRDGTIARIAFGDGANPDNHGAITLASGLNFGAEPLPSHLALDAQGRLFIPETAANRIQVLRDGDLELFTDVGLNRPVGLALRANGNLLATNHGDATIVEYNAEGEVVQAVDTGLGAEALYGITVRGNGEVYVVADDRGDGSVFRVGMQ